MTNKKSTKRALFVSALALLLSFAMLLGTTYAWFTDSASSTNNIIKTGNLDIELEYSTDFENWYTVEADTNVFSSTLWEPGHTEVVYLRIKNVGSLALKYRLNVNVASEVGSVNVNGEAFKLSQHIGYGVVENVTAKYDSREAAIAGVGDSFVYLEVPYAPEKQDLFPANDQNAVSETTLALVVYMPEDVGNEANYASGAATPTINLGINLFASQLSYEKDSYGSDYDAGADQVVANDEIVNIDNKVVAGVVNNGTVNIFNNSTVNGKLENNNGNATVTDSSVSNVGTVIDNNGGNLNVEGTDITQTSGTNYAAYTEKKNDENGEVIFTDVNIISSGGGIDVRDGNAVFNSGSIVTNSTATGARHVFYVARNASLVINEGTFTFSPTNLTRKGFYVCAQENAHVVINGGTFAKPSKRSNTNPATNYTTGFYADETSSIIVMGGTFGFDPSAWVATGYETNYDAATETWTVTKSGADASQALKDAVAAGNSTITLGAGTYTSNLKVPAGQNIEIVGVGAETVLQGQIATTSSTAGTITLKNLTFNVDSNLVDSTGISQTGKSAIAIWGNQTVICENVTFNMSLQDSTAITSWWDTGAGTTIIVRNCTFNCNGQRPIRATGNVTVENCTFNDPYRYAVQLTAKASTATELEEAIINFNNNTVVNGENGKDFVYGIQLEGGTYGCNNCVINGEGNTIVNGGDDSAMYYCDCGKVEHSSIEFNTEFAPVHKS